MMLLTHPAAIWLRNTLRAMGLARPIRLLFADRSYEAKVDAALIQMLRPGDIVWDIGANVGHYTVKMAEAVGSSGHVYAFEPSPSNFKRLLDACVQYPNITPLQLGLSSQNGSLNFVQGSDDLGATSRLARGRESLDQTIEIQVRRGDDLIAEGIAKPPTVFKIDVEGHEQHCMAGLSELISGKILRECIIEVHFGLLSLNGADNAPRAMANTLKDCGYRVDWVDVSHLRAVRI